MIRKKKSKKSRTSGKICCTSTFGKYQDVEEIKPEFLETEANVFQEKHAKRTLNGIQQYGWSSD